MPQIKEQKKYFEIAPDWCHIWTAAEAEDQLIGFQFDGPGLYYDDAAGSAMLVVPEDVELKMQRSGHWNIWRQEWPSAQQFRFMSYSADPTDSINALANAPKRGAGKCV